MFRWCLLFLYGISILKFDGAVATEEIPTKNVLPVSQTPEVINTGPLDDLSKNTELYDSAPNKLATPIEPTESLIPKNRIKRNSNWSFFPLFEPNIYFNPYNRVSSSWFKNLVDQYKTDLEMIQRRQNLILKSVECSTSGSDKCMTVIQPDVTEDLRALNYWNWGYNGPQVEYVTYDKLNAVMNSFKTSIEKLTLRQNMLYEYLDCSCPAKTECSTSLKPVLDVMFSNNGNVTGQLIHSLFVPGSSYYNPASSFFQTLASYVSHIPSWFVFNFSPLAFGSYHPVSTSSVTSSSMPSSTFSAATITPDSSTYATTSPDTTQTTPTISSNSVGSQPVYSSSSSFSSTTGSGQQVSGGYVSTSGGPSEEHYIVSSSIENTHFPSSSDGKGGSVSSVSSVEPKERIRRFADGASSGFSLEDLRINVAQIGLSAAQAGIQAAQIGINAGHNGAHIGATAAQHGLNAANEGIAAGLHAAG